MLDAAKATAAFLKIWVQAAGKGKGKKVHFSSLCLQR